MPNFLIIRFWLCIFELAIELPSSLLYIIDSRLIDSDIFTNTLNIILYQKDKKMHPSENL